MYALLFGYWQTTRISLKGCGGGGIRFVRVKEKKDRWAEAVDGKEKKKKKKKHNHRVCCNLCRPGSVPDGKIRTLSFLRDFEKLRHRNQASLKYGNWTLHQFHYWLNDDWLSQVHEYPRSKKGHWPVKTGGGWGARCAGRRGSKEGQGGAGENSGRTRSLLLRKVWGQFSHLFKGWENTDNF